MEDGGWGARFPGRPAWSAAWAGALARAGVGGDARTWAVAASGGLAGLAAIGFRAAGPAGALLLVGAASGGLVLGLHAARGRGARRADAGLPELLDHVARNLRAGSDLVPALVAAADAVGGPHAVAVRVVAARAEAGAPLADALATWTAAHPRPPVRLLVAALVVATSVGAARARAVDAVAATLRTREAVAGEARTSATQARTAAGVMVTIPVAFAVVGSLADPRLAALLLGTPTGWACTAAALALDAAGAWWMHRIVERTT